MKELKQDFHIHTNYTDGQMTVAEIAKLVKERGLNSACISEHVRQNLSYDYDKLAKEIPPP